MHTPDADTVSTLLVFAFLMLMAALAMFAGQRGPAENLTQTNLEWRDNEQLTRND